MFRAFAFASAAAFTIASPAMAATTVTLNGVANSRNNPVQMALTAGTYNVQFLAFSDQYKVLNRFGVTNRNVRNWEAQFTYTFGTGIQTFLVGPPERTFTEDGAFAAVNGNVYTIAVASDAIYRFFINDSAPANNIGGIRFSISEASIAGGVPEPETWALLLLGFAVIGGALRARPRATVTYGH